MMAQLSHSTPLGRPLSSIIGVRCAGLRAIYSGERVWPQASVSAASKPAARANTRTVMLLTLGFSMLSFCAGFFADFALAFGADVLASGFAAALAATFGAGLAAALLAGLAAALAAGFFAFLVTVFAIVVLPLFLLAVSTDSSAPGRPTRFRASSRQAPGSRRQDAPRRCCNRRARR